MKFREQIEEQRKALERGDIESVRKWLDQIGSALPSRATGVLFNAENTLKAIVREAESESCDREYIVQMATESASEIDFLRRYFE